MKIYLAIPYTGYEEQSYKLANKYAAKIMNQGHIVFSPISHSHSIATQEELPGDWGFWKKQDESFINWCDEVRVINVGIDIVVNSKGVQEELLIANKLNKPIKFIKINNRDKWNPK